MRPTSLSNVFPIHWIILTILLLVPSLTGRAQEASARTITAIEIIHPREFDPVDLRHVELAATQFRLRIGDLPVRVSVKTSDSISSPGTPGLVYIYVGRPDSDPELARWLTDHQVAIPDATDPGPEGFYARIDADSPTAGQLAIVAGVSSRSILYGLGWVLQQTRFNDDGLYLKSGEICTAPSVQIRSTMGAEKQPMDPRAARETKARAWSFSEGLNYLDFQYMLGANQILNGWGSSIPSSTERSERAQDLDVGFIVCNSINGIGRENMQPGWRAHDAGGLHNANVCVSVPEAREFLLDGKEDYFAQVPRLDRIIWSPSDVAGCDCDACAPWSHTFYDLVKDLSERLHIYHPETKSIFANQDFQIADNEWFFSKIKNDNPSWIGGYCMAPGGSEQNTYGDVILNPKWENAPGPFPERAFLKSLRSYLHPGQEILSLIDISHWKRAENGIPYIDPILSEIYPRRTFNARPVAYHRVVTADISCVDGLLGYSEGNYDDFNKYLLLRLAWDPKLDARSIALEYYSYYTGEAAAETLADAVFQGEINYEKPLLENAAGIERSYELVTQARDLIPEDVLAHDWRYAMLAQRAVIDLYILRRQMALQNAYDSAIAELDRQLATNRPIKDLIPLIQSLENALEETPELLALRNEAIALDDLTDRNGGIRCAALLKIKDYDGIGVKWLASQLRHAAYEGESSSDIRNRISEVVNYDRTGPGEFYEDVGTLDYAPHFNFASGNLYYGTGSWADDSRPSQRTYAYSHSHQEGLEFQFDGLLKNTDYELILMHPNPSGVSFAINSPNEFDVVVNGEILHRVIPSGKGIDRISVRIPARLITNGDADIQFRRVKDRARSTCLSELWLRPVEG
ncbi:hypothetical protein H5P28_17865 [Ruficoccus amylovorans]|uniref:DUF4838 domain-containing protein n=1 Tax=Ruficoccus amylovorans TaxID=1804625 RepID=A0A842HJJ7_9BACT|nr:hypothetical protein [Ruficoccus amylovorans]MBC2596138.1 hypothetical protein [Ruficoccus amylovorans]